MDGVVILGGALTCMAAVVALVVVAVVAGRRRERDRREVLHRWAAAHGWTVVPDPAVDWSTRLPGRNRRGVTLALTGPLWGRRASVADYSHTETTSTTTSDGQGGTTHGTQSTTHHYTVLVVHVDRPSPYVGVQPRGTLSKWGRALFGTGTALGHEQFDKHFQVVGEPGASPYPLNAALLAAHVAGTVPVWTLQGTDLLAMTTGRLRDPATIPQLLGPLYRVADLLTGRVPAAGPVGLPGGPPGFGPAGPPTTPPGSGSPGNPSAGPAGLPSIPPAADPL
ncbi:hypothetical protein COUCH_18280 [Couchioplanes caeruleus]|uniref:hypothetical protein n=1 Tax=Couchioplanes caeruleus TaxID=56438 RepID=UPI0020BFE535|nr:hypothetical protein [Couchioplanes caeruleus]UQU68108.1 hypothetical protein COUCH_18280 [Couchioplanes caeruleus]